MKELETIVKKIGCKQLFIHTWGRWITRRPTSPVTGIKLQKRTCKFCKQVDKRITYDIPEF